MKSLSDIHHTLGQLEIDSVAYYFPGMCGVCHTRDADISLNDIVSLVCESEFGKSVVLPSAA